MSIKSQNITGLILLLILLTHLLPGGEKIDLKESCIISKRLLLEDSREYLLVKNTGNHTRSIEIQGPMNIQIDHFPSHTTRLFLLGAIKYRIEVIPGYKGAILRKNEPFYQIIEGEKKELETYHLNNMLEIIDLYGPNSKRPTEQEIHDYQKELTVNHFNMIDDAEYLDCIREALNRYKKECAEYREKFPKERLIDYTPESLTKRLKRGFRVINTNYDFTRRTEALYCGKDSWQNYNNAFYHKLYSKNKEKQYRLYCPTCKMNFEFERNGENCPHCKGKLIIPDYQIVVNKPKVGRISGHTMTIITKPPDPYPTMHFDARITRPIYPLMEPLGDMISPLYIASEELYPLIDSQFLADHPSILCDYSLWNELPEKRKQELINHVFHNHGLIIYHAPENKTEFIGSGTLVYQKTGYWENQQLEQLIDPANHIKTPVLKKNSALSKIKNKVKITVEIGILFYLAICFGVPYLLCYRSRNIKMFPVYLTLFSSIFIVIIFAVFLTKSHNLYSALNRLTILDQNNGIQYIADKQNLFQITETKDPLRVNRNFNNPILHSKHLNYTKNELIIGRTISSKGKTSLLSNHQLIPTRKNCQFDFKNKTIINHLDRGIQQLLVHNKGRWYFAREIKPGKKNPLYPIQNLHQVINTQIFRNIDFLVKKKDLQTYMNSINQEFYLVLPENNETGIILNPVNIQDQKELIIGLYGDKQNG